MTYSSKLHSHYLALAKVPVCAENFAGEEVRFSNEYEVLEGELGKGNSLHESGRTDWLKVREGSEALLRCQSKDLRVVAWLTWALHQCESFAGLLAGLGLMRYLCEHHWVELHPAKPRTRGGAIVWLLPRLEQVLGDDVPVKDQLPLFRTMVEHLEALDAIFSKRLGDDAPLILPMCRRLASMVQRAADGLPEPGSVGAVVAQVKQAATQLLSPGAAIDSEKEAGKALRAQQESARPLCTWWLRQKATDLRALRLNRTLLWLPIEAMPERNAEQITALRGLPADKLNSYRERFAAGKYADLLVDLEASLARAPFWFDGQYMVWECLQALNAAAAMREVEVQLALFLQRLPGVVDLCFHDGQPFAEPATRNWISVTVMPHLHADTAPVRQVESSANRSAWEQALEEVEPVLRKDGLKAAVQVLKQGLLAASGGRERFLWQFGLARLCHQAKKYELARTQLETLDQQLHAAGLNGWEPDLALQVIRLLHNCCELLPQNHAVRERKDEIYRRLCHLDLEVVLE
ncbi:MAG: type VI secretion system protein TssA [Pseudomonas sp.]